MKTRRGEVILVLFPNSDLRTAKRRPALVIQREDLASGLPQTIVAMISTNLARLGHPSRVFVSVNSAEGHAAGLRLDSVIMTDNLTTVLESEIDSILGRTDCPCRWLRQKTGRNPAGRHEHCTHYCHCEQRSSDKRDGKRSRTGGKSARRHPRHPGLYQLQQLFRRLQA